MRGPLLLGQALDGCYLPSQMNRSLTVSLTALPLGLLLLALMGSAASMTGQVTATLEVDKSRLLPRETFNVSLKIVNFSGRHRIRRGSVLAAIRDRDRDRRGAHPHRRAAESRGPLHRRVLHTRHQAHRPRALLRLDRAGNYKLTAKLYVKQWKRPLPVKPVVVFNGSFSAPNLRCR